MTPRGRVLIVDDYAPVTKGLRALLEPYFLYVCIAPRIDSALTELAMDCFDVVVVDWVLPDGSGRQLVEFIARHYPEAVIIVFSGFPKTDSESAALGVHQFVEKGREGSDDLIQNAILRGIEQSRARRA